MKIRGKISKLAAIFLVSHMLMFSGPYTSVWAAMVSTEIIINVDRDQGPCGCLSNHLAHEEIQAALISRGIDPREARDRIGNLSEDEICKFVNEIDQLPAGGSTLGVLAFFVTVLVLVLADIFFNNSSPK